MYLANLIKLNVMLILKVIKKSVYHFVVKFTLFKLFDGTKILGYMVYVYPIQKIKEYFSIT